MSKKIKIPTRAAAKPNPDSWVDQAATSKTGDTSGKPKRLTIDLDSELHRRLKMHCVAEDIEIATLIRGFITNTVSGTH